MIVHNVGELKAALAGSTEDVFLAPGEYAGTFVCRMKAKPGQVLRIAPLVPGTSVVIDGMVTFAPEAEGVTLEGVVICSRAWRLRKTAQTGSWPSEMAAVPGNAVSMRGQHCSVVRCVIMDVRQGIQISQSATGSRVEGCVIFNVGWIGGARGHGHGIYVQGESLSSDVILSRNLIGFVAGLYGIHGYAEKAGLCRIRCYENVLFSGTDGAALLIGGYTPVVGAGIVGNHLWKPSGARVMVGYGWGAAQVMNESAVIRRNFAGREPLVRGLWGDGQPLMEDNQWRSQDLDAVYVTPIHDEETVDLRRYRFHVVVYNRSASYRVLVPVPPELEGYRLRVRNGQDYFYDIQTPLVQQGKFSLVCEGRTVAEPFGLDEPWERTTFPYFGVFVVEVDPCEIKVGEDGG